MLEHCYTDDSDFVMGYSGDVPSDIPTKIKSYGNSQFLSEIEGRDPDEVFPLLDELVATIQVVNPRLYASFIRKLTEY